MTKLLLYKDKTAQLAAEIYLNDWHNSLGKYKGKPRKYRSFYFGPNNRETALLIKALNRNRRKTFWQKIIAAAEQERAKEMTPILLYKIEPPKDGEYIDNNPLTMQEFNAML
jgi:hypothetical protein